MKAKKIASAAAAVALLGTQLGGASVFAANPYGIQYTGGNPLGAENVQIDSDLVESLVPLMQVNSDIYVDFSDSDRIEYGYLRAGSSGSRCTGVWYVTVSNDNLVAPEDDITFYLTQDDYTISVDLKNVALENIEDDRTYAVGIGDYSNVLYTGYHIYEDDTCQTRKSGINHLGTDPSERVFVDLSLKNYEAVENQRAVEEILPINGLYFALTDIDMGQSYRILNANNTLKTSRMYAYDAEDLQSRRGSTLRNMYVENGEYIYSEYSYDGFDMSTLNLPDTANVFTPVYNKTQNDGLNIVLGFVSEAYNGIEFYVSDNEEAHITYSSDSHGTISGKKSEDIEVGGNPTGTTIESKDGYEFSHWVANVDVELKDFTIIAAGEPISDAQVKNILVTRDLTLTAVHKEDDSAPAVPNTGAFTGNTSATIATISLVGITLGALTIRLLPRFHHKKMGFEK